MIRAFPVPPTFLMLNSLTADIQTLLRSITHKTAIIGVGNSLRGDDGVGPYIAEQLGRQTGLRVIDAGTVPENYLDEVASFEPDLVIIFDAAEFRGHPGEVRIVDEHVIPLATLSTHSIPLSVIYHLLEKDTEAAVIFVGVQPKQLDMQEGLSIEVKASSEEIINFILKEFKRA